MKLSALILITIFIVGNIYAQKENKIDKIFQLKIEHALISRGDNFPDFNVKKDSLDKFLFALHKNISPNEFQLYTKFSDAKMNTLISFLESKNWLHKINNEYKPTVFVADAKDGELLYKYAEPISSKITKAIVKNLPKLKTIFENTEISKNNSFNNWSFLILSDVLLDSWQIDNVEKYFLKQNDRPLRNGNHYYYIIRENTNSQIESFGIYGNQFQQIGGRYISIYGNKRQNLTISSSDNLVSKADNEYFAEMAKSFLPDLLNILEDERNYSKNIYSKSGYDKEICFEEFFIWWYHFIYTQATNEMNKKGFLSIPKSGNFDYMILE